MTLKQWGDSREAAVEFREGELVGINEEEGGSDAGGKASR